MTETTIHRGALPAGTRVHEFEFREVIGHGGFGITYRGWDHVLDLAVAIKEYLPAGVAVRVTDMSVHPKSQEDEADYQWGLERFLDEARMLARFEHPAIVGVRRFFEAHGTAYIVMEYVQGQTLGALYAAERTLAESRLRTLLEPILAGLEQVHGAGFLHRDIKPGNVMLRGGGAPVLVDFGSARAEIATRSQSMTTVVTPGFAPIEQYSTRGRQGPWTDIYAVGAVLYRGMTGVVPEDATSRVLDDELTPAARAAKGAYGKPLLEAVDWALRVHAAERPQSIAQWREALEGRDASPVSPAAAPAAPPAPPRPARPDTEGSSGGRWWQAILAVAALWLAVGGLWWWDQQVPPSAPDPGRTAQEAAAREAAEREALLAEYEGALERGEYDAAREALRGARAAGLPEASYDERLARIDQREEEARVRRVAELLAACREHESGRRLDEALGCFMAVLALDESNAEAAAGMGRLESLAAWVEARETHTVEGYWAFEQAHAESRFAGLARQRLERLEPEHWAEVRVEDTSETYERYLEIYPAGRFAELAKRRLARRDTALGD